MVSLLFFFAVGVASQIHYQDITLVDLVSSSPIIAVVQAAEPPRRVVTVPIGEGLPDFAVHVRRVEIVEVLKAPDNHKLTGQVVETAPANVEDLLQLERLRAQQEISRSPIVFQYRSERIDQNALPETWVMFFRPCTVNRQPMLCQSFEGGVEAIEKRDVIQQLISP